MRSIQRFCVAGALALAVAGCSSGNGVEEGVPKNIDMTKDYSPKVDMPGMSPKAASAAKAASKKAGEANAAAPAEPAK